MKQHQTTVIGGGAVGLSIAWELAQRGVQVTLLERDRIGRATSHAGAGILPAANRENATDPLDQLRGLSHDLFPQWTRRLASVSGIDPGFRRCGGWYLADTRGEQAAMHGMTSYWNELGIDCEPVSRQLLCRREPALKPWADESPGATAWWVNDESQVRPPRLLQALRDACGTEGVELIEKCVVTDIQPQGDRVQTMVSDRAYMSDSIVVCAGVWSGQIARALQLELSMIPIRGQMLLLKSVTPLVQAVVNVGHRYIVCRDDGYTLIGSCEEEAGFHLGTTDVMLRSLRQFANRLLPGLSTVPQAGAWSGLRPMTFDGFPMIGRAPGTSNVYIAAGHHRSGLHLSPATAVVIGELILGLQPSINLDPFRVGKQQSKSTTSI